MGMASTRPKVERRSDPARSELRQRCVGSCLVHRNEDRLGIHGGGERDRHVFPDVLRAGDALRTEVPVQHLARGGISGDSMDDDRRPVRAFQLQELGSSSRTIGGGASRDLLDDVQRACGPTPSWIEFEREEAERPVVHQPVHPKERISIARPPEIRSAA